MIDDDNDVRMTISSRRWVNAIGGRGRLVGMGGIDDVTVCLPKRKFGKIKRGERSGPLTLNASIWHWAWTLFVEWEHFISNIDGSPPTSSLNVADFILGTKDNVIQFDSIQVETILFQFVCILSIHKRKMHLRPLFDSMIRYQYMSHIAWMFVQLCQCLPARKCIQSHFVLSLTKTASMIFSKCFGCCCFAVADIVAVIVVYRCYCMQHFCWNKISHYVVIC